MDLVADFARPLPFTVITEVLGVPPADRDWLAGAVATLNRGFARQRDTDRTAVQAANDAASQMLSYFTSLLDQRTAAPADDLMTVLAARHADGEDRQDLAANCIFFINAGHQTTTTLLTLGAHLLCTHPEALTALQEDPGRWPAAVEEMLRLITPTTFTAATPRHHADIHGVPCAAGQPRLLFLAAANRDPSIFPDPDRFDISRDPNPHLSFSAGAHYCLGAPLARLHGEVALSALFTRLPSLAAHSPARHHRQRSDPPGRPLPGLLAATLTSSGQRLLAGQGSPLNSGWSPAVGSVNRQPKKGDATTAGSRMSSPAGR